MDQDATRKADSYPFARLLSDLKKRFPATKPATVLDKPAGTEIATPRDGEFAERIGKLPKEVGTLLVAVGLAGILLPGPVGSPFVLAGGLVLWPAGFDRIEGWFERKFPGLHREGVKQIRRFLSDLEQRYPGSTGPIG